MLVWQLLHTPQVINGSHKRIWFGRMLVLVAGMGLGVPGDQAAHIFTAMQGWLKERGKRLAGRVEVP